MSVNNLASNLSWLLASEAFVPVAKRWPARTDPLPVYDSDGEQHRPKRAKGSSRRDSQADEQRHDAESTQTVTGGMARLRAGPSPTRKPQVQKLSDGQTPPHVPSMRTNARWNLPDTHPAHGEMQGSEASPKEDRGESVPRRRTPRTVDVHADPVKTAHQAKACALYASPSGHAVDTIDLTETGALQQPGNHYNGLVNNFDSTTSSTKPMSFNIQAGRKRKSEDYEQELSKRRAYSRCHTDSREGSPSSTFHGFDLLHDAEDDPPPPYSTTADEIADYTPYFSHSSDSHDRSQDGAGLAACASPSNPQKQHLPASAVSTPYRNHGTQNFQKRSVETPTPVPRTVADSDGESDVDSRRPHATQSAQKSSKADEQREISEDFNGRLSRRNSTRESVAAQDNRDPSVPGAHVQVHPLRAQTSSSDEPARTGQDTTPIQNEQTILHDELSATTEFELLDSIPAWLKPLCQMPSAHFAQHQHDLSMKIKDTSKAILSHLVETSARSQPLNDLMNGYKKQLSTTEELLRTRQQYYEDLRRRRILEELLVTQISQGLSTEPRALSELRSYRDSLPELEKKLGSLLQNSEYAVADMLVSSSFRQSPCRPASTYKLGNEQQVIRDSPSQTPSSNTPYVVQTQQRLPASKIPCDTSEVPRSPIAKAIPRKDPRGRVSKSPGMFQLTRNSIIGIKNFLKQSSIRKQPSGQP